MAKVTKALVVLIGSQFAFYIAVYFYLKTTMPAWRFLLLGIPVFAYANWAPLWALRTAHQVHWPLLPVQLTMFAAAVLASLLGMIVFHREIPTIYGWIGLGLVVGGVVLSTIN